jgi:DnaJ like chaperone protein
MAFLGKLIGGMAGLAVGGPLGAMLGVAAGHIIDEARRRPAPQLGQRLRLDALIDTGFALMGYIAKADGRVSEAEIAAAEAWMQRLDLSAMQRQRAMARFEAGKRADFSVARAIGEFRAQAGADARLLQTLLQMQVSVATADGRLSAASRQALAAVLSRLGLPAALLDTVLGQSSAAGGGRRVGPSAPRIEQDYAVLGVPASADQAAIKSAYRRLMSRHHPDRASDDPRAAARAQAINDAYRRIREARGF